MKIEVDVKKTWAWDLLDEKRRKINLYWQFKNTSNWKKTHLIFSLIQKKYRFAYFTLFLLLLLICPQESSIFNDKAAVKINSKCYFFKHFSEAFLLYKINWKCWKYTF